MKKLLYIVRKILDMIRRAKAFIRTEIPRQEIPDELYKKWSDQLILNNDGRYGKPKKVKLDTLWKEYRKTKI